MTYTNSSLLGRTAHKGRPTHFCSPLLIWLVLLKSQEKFILATILFLAGRRRYTQDDVDSVCHEMKLSPYFTH